MQTIKNVFGFTIGMTVVSCPMIIDVLFGTHLTMGYVAILLMTGLVRKYC